MVLVAGADTLQGAGVARAVIADGAAVVVCGADEVALGALVAELHAAGARVAMFVGDPTDGGDRRSLAEMVGELFAVPDA